MKARIKETGEIVEICPDSLAGFLAPDKGSYYKEEELSTELDDWSSFRREAAKDAMAGMMANADFWHQVWSNNRVNGRCDYPSEIAHFAIACADELIKQIKQLKQQ